VYPARSCNCDRLCTCRGHTRRPVSRAPIRCGAASRRRCAKPSDGLRFHRMQAWAEQATSFVRAEPADERVQRLWAEAEAVPQTRR
jgi:hypothetical protein